MLAAITPSFAEAVPNVTVVQGKDAILPCIVDHLEHFKVNPSYLNQRIFNGLTQFVLRHRWLGFASTRRPF